MNWQLCTLRLKLKTWRHFTIESAKGYTLQSARSTAENLLVLLLYCSRESPRIVRVALTSSRCQLSRIELKPCGLPFWLMNLKPLCQIGFWRQSMSQPTRATPKSGQSTAIGTKRSRIISCTIFSLVCLLRGMYLSTARVNPPSQTNKTEGFCMKSKWREFVVPKNYRSRFLQMLLNCWNGPKLRKALEMKLTVSTNLAIPRCQVDWKQTKRAHLEEKKYWKERKRNRRYSPTLRRMGSWIRIKKHRKRALKQHSMIPRSSLATVVSFIVRSIFQSLMNLLARHRCKRRSWAPSRTLRPR